LKDLQAAYRRHSTGGGAVPMRFFRQKWLKKLMDIAHNAVKSM
jgi:hypothetical protein